MYPHLYSDRLVALLKDGTIRGKRIPKDCPISRAAVRAYVEHGPIACVKQIREEKPGVLFLKEAVDLMCAARGRALTDKPPLTNIDIEHRKNRLLRKIKKGTL